MTANLLTFVDRAQERPTKRKADLRRTDFQEIFDEFTQARAGEQASRCSQCGVPFCQVHCPLQNNIPDWLKLTAEGRLEEAYEISSATNTFPEICGRICPQDRLCEGNCVIEKGFESVTIGAVERYITETAFENGWVSGPKPVRERDQSIGIIGGGPAGLAAADMLRRHGYSVAVYDRHDRIGGLMIYGIPGFKLEKEVVERRTELLAASGIVFHTSTEVGRDISFADLRARHDAVLIATGVYEGRDIKVPGVGLEGVVPALDFLIASNRKSLGDDVPAFESGALNAAGKNVVVIGGGDTAMDCVRTAVRQGARAVTCLYRRDRTNMPGSQREVSYAMEEGVRFEFLSAPEAFLGRNHVEAVRAVKMRLGEPDASGRLTPQIVSGSEYRIEADLVLKALGFDPEPVAASFDLPELEMTRWGTVKTAMLTGVTSMPGVYAAGDIVRGASLVVWAIRDGRDAAEAMHKELQMQAAAAEAMHKELQMQTAQGEPLNYGKEWVDPDGRGCVIAIAMRKRPGMTEKEQCLILRKAAAYDEGRGQFWKAEQAEELAVKLKQVSKQRSLPIYSYSMWEDPKFVTGPNARWVLVPGGYGVPKLVRRNPKQGSQGRTLQEII